MHAAIVSRVKVTPHPDPEVHSLAVGNVCGETVIVSKDTEDNALGLYFPCELQLGYDFAAVNDLVRRKNEDGSKAGGMFEENRRVRAQKFRGIKSCGFWCPISYLGSFGDTSVLNPGDKITEFCGVEIAKKYITPKTERMSRNQASKKYTAFPEHKETDHLARSTADLKAGQTLVVTLKMHGTSQRVAKNIEEAESRWYDKLFNLIGFSRTQGMREYNGTRRVTLKGEGGGYYSESWRDAVARRLMPYLEDHMQVFFEVVGYEGQKSIMPSHSTNKSKEARRYGETMTYSYGCNPGEFDVYIYRIAYVLPNGTTIDLTWDQVKKKCEQWNVKHVPELDRFIYNGDEESLIERVDSLSDGEDPIDTRHVREGVCVRVDSSEWRAYKHKGWTFKVLEGIAKENDDYVDQEEVS